ncbi:MAG: crossover junction endodeoxyribonuclease RuvC [Chlamydiia bacterium]|nr:crossover junction endodeoxyribonuclease RuvC [Chlamydiia bacterium]
MIILGVDPGTRITGFGIIRESGSKLEALDFGCIRPPAGLETADRYLILFEGILELIDRYQPQALAVETQYVHKNVQSALKLGMARGAITVAARSKGVAVFEYAPTQAKLAVTGSGRASKVQVQGMVKHVLHLEQLPQPEDAADALAIAVCHAHHSKQAASLATLVRR